MDGPNGPFDIERMAPAVKGRNRGFQAPQPVAAPCTVAFGKSPPIPAFAASLSCTISSSARGRPTASLWLRNPAAHGPTAP